MGAINRGLKNAFRNGIRSISVILILSIAIGMTLIMFMSLRAVQNKIDSIKSSIGNTITVSPAGMRGFEGSGTLMTNQNVTDVQSLENVKNVVATFCSRLTTIGATTQSFGPGGGDSTSTAKTSLTAPPMQAPSGSDNNRRTMVNGQDVTGQNFSMPISVIGINGLDNLSALNVTSFTLSSGEKIDPTSSENVAMLGQSIASENNISVGSTFTAYDQTITVKGIFDAGNTFANSEIVMPLATVQNLSGETDQVNSIIATTSSIDTVSSVKDAITNKLGSSSVDVTSQQDQSNEAIAPLENIKTISLYSLIGSTVAGAVILFLTMVMIVRERRREIGVLKAIGASNLLVTSQFMVESLVLTVISSGIGIIAGTLFSNPVLKILVSNNESSTGGGARFSGGGGGAAMMRFGAGIADSAQGALRNLQANVGLDIILYGIGAAVVIAIIGSAIPSFIIAKIRPAEVMRAE